MKVTTRLSQSTMALPFSVGYAKKECPDCTHIHENIQLQILFIKINFAWSGEEVN